jgi:hypothetical protein
MMNEGDFSVLQTCADHVAADIVANFLRAESVPAVVRNRAPVPGLEQGTDVLVPTALLSRARWLLAQQPPTDAELSYLATQAPPEGTN